MNENFPLLINPIGNDVNNLFATTIDKKQDFALDLEKQ